MITLDGTNGITTPDVDTDGLTVDTNTLFVDAANNRVGVGTTAPAGALTVTSSGGAGVSIAQSNENFYAGSLHRFFDLNYANERARIDASGNMGINRTSPSAKLDVNGSFKYVSSLAVGGINVLSSATFNNNSANSLGAINFGFMLIAVNQGNGLTVIPFFLNAGGGVAWSGSMFDPDNGVFNYGSGPSVSFATVGSSANSYTVAMDGGSGIVTITRTAGSAAYTVHVLVLMTD
jgi:hypothetical protein